MTGKQRAQKRAQANGLEPLFQIGKGGISPALIKQTNDALDARELIKLKVLTDSSPVTARQAADMISAETGAEVIQVIGGVIVLYRESEVLKAKAEQKKKNIAKAQKKARQQAYERLNRGKSRFKSHSAGRR